MPKANPKDIDETTVLGGRVRLLQPREGLRAGLDAVMVAAACPAKAGARVLDLGCGTGAAGLCVAARVPGTELTGLDIQPELIALARQNGPWAQFIAGDLRDKSLLPPDHFDHAVCNPPYMQEGAWYETPDKVRAKALGKVAGDALLADWIDCLQRVIVPGGTLAMIHRADHGDLVIRALGTRFGGMEIWPLHPHAGEDANRIVVRVRKNSKSPARFHTGIVLHEADGAWSARANAILTDAAALG